MKFQLKAKGFSTQAICISVMPSTIDADKVSIKIETNSLGEGTFQNFVSSPVNPLTGYSELNCELKENHVWDEQSDDWSDEIDFLGCKIRIPSDFVGTFLKEFTNAFYEFHRKQNETAQITIQKIRSLRIEDIVGEQCWEVTKTTSRRGRR